MDAADRKGRGVDGDARTTVGLEASATVGLENGDACICGSPVILVGTD